MQIVYRDASGTDRSRTFRCILALRRLLPARIMKTLWFRLLTGPGAIVNWSRDADWDGAGRLELCGSIAALKNARFDLRAGIVRLGSGVVINAFTILWQDAGGVMDLADGVYVGPHCVLDGTGGLRIGAATMLGPGVKINASSHGTAPGLPYRDQPFSYRGVSIGANVWIGSNAVIVDGVTIGDGAIVGAGAVVTHDVPARHLALGVPAKAKPIADA
jgi:acetyltransferase-like isoleucine patch superfamily enzyme